MHNDNHSSRDAVKSAPWWNTDDLIVHIEDEIRSGTVGKSLVEMSEEELLIQYALLDIQRRQCAIPEGLEAWNAQATIGDELYRRGHLITVNRGNPDCPVFTTTNSDHEYISVNWLGEQIESLYK